MHANMASEGFYALAQKWPIFIYVEPVYRQNPIEPREIVLKALAEVKSIR